MICPDLIGNRFKSDEMSNGFGTGRASLGETDLLVARDVPFCLCTSREKMTARDHAGHLALAFRGGALEGICGVIRSIWAKYDNLLWQMGQHELTLLGVDSDSILFNHRSFPKPDLFPWVFDAFLKRRIPGKNGEGTPRTLLKVLKLLGP